MKKLAAFIVLTFALTACGGGGSSTSEESFVSGDGSTTFIKISDRKIAPAITGMGSLPANAIPTTVILDKSGLVAARISGVVTVASLSELIEKVSAE